MSFSGQAEGEYLRGLVSLVQECGEDNMLRALAKCEAEEANATIVCTTVHKAKGREWRYVSVDNDFQNMVGRPIQSTTAETKLDRKTLQETELRLLYVAVTRAKVAVQIPPRSRLINV